MNHNLLCKVEYGLNNASDCWLGKLIKWWRLEVKLISEKYVHVRASIFASSVAAWNGSSGWATICCAGSSMSWPEGRRLTWRVTLGHVVISRRQIDVGKSMPTSLHVFFGRWIQHGYFGRTTLCCEKSNMGWIMPPTADPINDPQSSGDGRRSKRCCKSKYSSVWVFWRCRLRHSSSGWATSCCSTSDPVTFNDLRR